MKKQKEFQETKFDAQVLRDATEALKKLAAQAEIEIDRLMLNVDHGDADWSYDSLDEFFSDYRKFSIYSIFNISGNGYELSAVFSRNATTAVTVRAPARSEIEAVFDIFEARVSESKLPAKPRKVAEKPVVFIGHGGNRTWRDLKDHLTDKHGVRVEAYETGARAGHTIRDVLEEMISKSSFAVLVMTAEDEQADGGLRARQNVIHEAGLFQGRLGFARAILLLEEGVELFSNVQGIQYIRFSKDNIKETFGEVLATLRREFPDSR